jgi:GrpB-like predicted nucleotidyltransferase (UPF0157 family)
MRRVEVVDYDSRWPGRFLAEAERIRRVLGEVVLAVHHVGSTSVPGLVAKPVIDVFLQVSSLDALDAQAGALEGLGYEGLGEFGLAGRRYFRKGGDQRTHHIHAYAADNPEPLRHLHFRDYLRAHPEFAAEYGRLKRRCAATHGQDPQAYSDAKGPFIVGHEARAMAWAAERSEVPDEPVADPETLYGVAMTWVPSSTKD